DLSRAQVGRLAGVVAPHGDERIRLLGAARDRAARTVVLERAPHEVHAVGEQRGGERVAGTALVGASVEAEVEWPRAIDAAAGGPSRALVHGRAAAVSCGRGSPTL